MPPRGKLYDKTSARNEARRALFAAAQLLMTGFSFLWCRFRSRTPGPPPSRRCRISRRIFAAHRRLGRVWRVKSVTLAISPYSSYILSYIIMKTTLNIDDTIMAELKREAVRQGRTMSELVETALRLLLRSHRKREKLVALPTFHSGGVLLDIADRNVLYQAMEGR